MRWYVTLWVVVFAASARAETILLDGDHWKLRIDPATLAVESEVGTTRAVLSSPRDRASAVADLKHDARSAVWKLTDAAITVSAKLDGDALTIDFVADAPSKFTWPTISPRDAGKAFILPMSEGVYVPADDEPWAKFLVDQGPMTTTADLSMPFWGVDVGGQTITYLITNPFNNELEFSHDAGRLGLAITHDFTRNHAVKTFGYRIQLGDASPVTPAKIYRQRLIDAVEFVPLTEKIKRVPETAKLLGAAHVYLWSDDAIARPDILDYRALAKLFVEAPAGSSSPAAKCWRQFSPDVRNLIATLPGKEFIDNYDKGVVAAALSEVLEKDDWRTEIKLGVLSQADRVRGNAEILIAAYPGLFKPFDTWGDGYSTKMMQSLADAGLDRLWLGSPNYKGLGEHPIAVKKAIELGYLIGPYDSYHSIHSPDEKDTWETAQLGKDLFETGPIIRADGTMKAGFKQKGFILSPLAARPIVEARITRLMGEFNCNSWFFDCDAFGEVFDDYSPAHPATQAEDAAARVARMKWVGDTFHAVVGSEGGSAYAAPAIAFAHGMMTPTIGWGDPDLMKDKTSKFYLGRYYPPEGPDVFFKTVPMKPEYARIYADPKFRLPLYEIVFHDSVVATHQWGSGSFKFDDRNRVRELFELLYCVPPLYHLNLAEFAKRKSAIAAHYQFWSPLHRELAMTAMTDFAWLTADKSVQRTTFADGTAITVNFGELAWNEARGVVPARSCSVNRGAAVTGYPAPGENRIQTK